MTATITDIAPGWGTFATWSPASGFARQLGISRNTLYRKIKRHGIQITRAPEET